MKAFGLWLSAAATIFANGLLHGSVAGGAAALAVLKGGKTSHAAALTFVGVAGANAVKRVVVWSDANPIPNPFPGFVPQPDSPAAPAAPAPEVSSSTKPVS